MQPITAAFNVIAAMTHLVEHHAFDGGDDNGVYFNYTFRTQRARDLWHVVRTKINNREFGVHMGRASIAVISSEAGWDEYLLLHHFDPQVKTDAETAL